MLRKNNAKTAIYAHFRYFGVSGTPKTLDRLNYCGTGLATRNATYDLIKATAPYDHSQGLRSGKSASEERMHTRKAKPRP
jgi:hypothetical protein